VGRGSPRGVEVGWGGCRAAAVSPKSSLRPKLVEGGDQSGVWPCSSAWSSGSVDDGGVLALPERKRGAG
jgi:hypothetical protein